MYYSLLKKFLFRLDPEKSHYFALNALKWAQKLRFIPIYPHINAPRELLGMTFSNPVGLAAGLDKNGDYIEALAALGFGFIEIGTVTPKPQAGNPQPRLFRLIEQKAIINRMGFNNKGLDYVVERLRKTKYRGILGVNIGKNKDTPLEKAADDYLLGFRRVAQYASYVTINISSPNTQGLRDLQQSELLRSLLRALKQEQKIFHELNKKYVPLVVKIAPDLTQEEIKDIAEILLAEKLDAVIATNTTLSRAGVENSAYANETGGLSGQPLFQRSTKVVAELQTILQNRIPIIACGGIFSKKDAVEKFAAGASLVQIYSGFIYEGPKLIAEVAKSLIG